MGRRERREELAAMNTESLLDVVYRELGPNTAEATVEYVSDALYDAREAAIRAGYAGLTATGQTLEAAYNVARNPRKAAATTMIAATIGWGTVSMQAAGAQEVVTTRANTPAEVLSAGNQYLDQAAVAENQAMRDAARKHPNVFVLDTTAGAQYVSKEGKGDGLHPGTTVGWDSYSRATAEALGNVSGKRVAVYGTSLVLGSDEKSKMGGRLKYHLETTSHAEVINIQGVNSRRTKETMGALLQDQKSLKDADIWIIDTANNTDVNAIDFEVGQIAKIAQENNPDVKVLLTTHTTTRGPRPAQTTTTTTPGNSTTSTTKPGPTTTTTAPPTTTKPGGDKISPVIPAAPPVTRQAAKVGDLLASSNFESLAPSAADLARGFMGSNGNIDVPRTANPATPPTIAAPPTTEAPRIDTRAKYQEIANNIPGDVRQQVENNNIPRYERLRGVYEDIEHATGVPAEIMMVVHDREGGNDPNKSMWAGERLGSVNPDTKQVMGTNLLENGISAAEHFKHKARSVYGVEVRQGMSDEEVQLAFLAYNRGSMYANAGERGFGRPWTPWDSPYVVNGIDGGHWPMRFPAYGNFADEDNRNDGYWGEPRSTQGDINRAIGAYTSYVIIKARQEPAPAPAPAPQAAAPTTVEIAPSTVMPRAIGRPSVIAPIDVLMRGTPGPVGGINAVPEVVQTSIPKNRGTTPAPARPAGPVKGISMSAIPVSSEVLAKGGQTNPGIVRTSQTPPGSKPPTGTNLLQLANNLLGGNTPPTPATPPATPEAPPAPPTPEVIATNRALAHNILSNPRVELDPGTPRIRQQLEAIADGGDPNSCGREADTPLLTAINRVAQDHSIRLTSFVRPEDGCEMPHGVEIAFDVGYFDGQPLNGTNQASRDFIRAVIDASPGQRLRFGVGDHRGSLQQLVPGAPRSATSFPDIPNHVHVDTGNF